MSEWLILSALSISNPACVPFNSSLPLEFAEVDCSDNFHGDVEFAIYGIVISLHLKTLPFKDRAYILS
jgi:hypothetical protein